MRTATWTTLESSVDPFQDFFVFVVVAELLVLYGVTAAQWSVLLPHNEKVPGLKLSCVKSAYSSHGFPQSALVSSQRQID